jgi:hypothetical protein
MRKLLILSATCLASGFVLFAFAAGFVHLVFPTNTIKENVVVKTALELAEEKL